MTGAPTDTILNAELVSALFELPASGPGSAETHRAICALCSVTALPDLAP